MITACLKRGRSRPRGQGPLAIAIVLALTPILTPHAGAQPGSRPGKVVAESICAECHGEGVNGAPRIGDRDAWIPRLRHGVPFLVQSAIRGHGGMPARGGVAALTDVEVREAVVYMFNPTAPAARDGARHTRHDMLPPPSDPNHRTVGSMEIYLGVMPATNLQKFSRDAPERSMHGGVPWGDDYHHVNVTLLDRQSNAAITGANVEIRVRDPGLRSATTTLQPMAIGTPSYGNYVKLHPNTNYVIDVRVRAPGSYQFAEVQFEHQH